jgi:hypothetical protein
MRWLWLAKTETTRPWASLAIQVPKKVKDFFSMAMQTEIGNGATTFFWTDRWLLGHKIADLTPRLFGIIPKRRVNKRTVVDAISNQSWISDIQGALSIGIINEFLILWDLIDSIVLRPQVEDKHFFRLAANEKFSKEAYRGFFMGSSEFEPFHRIWKTWAPPKTKFFMWLVAHRKVWTADRLQKRGMDHPERCPLCDQDQETLDHMLIGCVFAREFWFKLLLQVNLQLLAPQSEDSAFLEWWRTLCTKVSGIARDGLNSLVILGVWTLWKQHNGCVFDNKSPSIADAIRRVGLEVDLWEMARAKKLSLLTAPIPGLPAS